MNKNKKELIEEYLAKPLQRGDLIWVPEGTMRNPDKKELREFDKQVGDTVYYKLGPGNGVAKAKIADIKKDTRNIGADPFKEPFRARQYNIDMWQLLYRMGWHQIMDGDNWELRQQKVDEWQVPEVNFDSCVTGPKGEDIMYQRGLVWSLEDKQLLIESIYNNIEIGKFVIRTREWAWVKKRLSRGQTKYTAFADVVDGKQRLNALLDFVTNQFADLYGNCWCDLSEIARYKFQKYAKFSFFEIDEDVTDADVLRQFLAINFTGASMSKEHIEYVRSIQL